MCAAGYLFVALVDPWGVLPASLPLARVPISTNARYSFPMLAGSARFDAAIFGTSTSRLLQPAQLDPLFGGARFVNLAMNSATAWEQSRLLGLFLRAHPHPRAVLIGLDIPWCATAPVYQTRTGRDFPDWMYDGRPWGGYVHLFTLYAVQEAANQFAVLAGLRRRRYGLDGYTPFTPPDPTYDAARARAHIAAEGTPDELGGDPTRAPSDQDYPAMALLRDDLAALPAGTQAVLFFVPYLRSYQGAPGTLSGAMWAECKRRVASLAAARPGTVLADFMRPSPITDDPTHYWDPKHYRVGVAARLAGDLAELAATGRADADAAVLAGGPAP